MIIHIEQVRFILGCKDGLLYTSINVIHNINKEEKSNDHINGHRKKKGFHKI